MFSAGTDSLGDHGVLVPGDVRTARIAEVENAVYLYVRLGAREITCHEPTDILCEGYAKFAGALARTPLQLVFQGNLCS
ncbi:MAG TPA: hypothetical protein VI756_18570 [Blastocatellia bacterium]